MCPFGFGYGQHAGKFPGTFEARYEQLGFFQFDNPPANQLFSRAEVNLPFGGITFGGYVFAPAHLALMKNKHGKIGNVIIQYGRGAFLQITPVFAQHMLNAVQVSRLLAMSVGKHAAKVRVSFEF